VFVAFSATGGNTGLANFTDGSSIQSSYGSGGGPKVTFLAKIDPANGDITPRGTFVAGRLSAASNLRANTVNPCTLEIAGADSLRLTAITAYDGGAAADSLQPGVECLSGSTRVLTANFNLTTIQDVLEVDREDWPTETFTPSFLQILGSLGLIAAGFAISWGVSHLAPKDDEPGRRDDN